MPVLSVATTPEAGSIVATDGLDELHLPPLLRSRKPLPLKSWLAARIAQKYCGFPRGTVLAAGPMKSRKGPWPPHGGLQFVCAAAEAHRAVTTTVKMTGSNPRPTCSDNFLSTTTPASTFLFCVSAGNPSSRGKCDYNTDDYFWACPYWRCRLVSEGTVSNVQLP